MPTALGGVEGAKPEMKESVEPLVTDKIDRSTVSPVATRGPSTRNELLASEGDTAIPTTSTLDMNEGFIDEGQFWVALDARLLAGEPSGGRASRPAPH